MDIFSTREIATFIWVMLLLFYSLKSDDVAKSILEIFKAFSDLKLVFILEALAIYVMLLCYALSPFMTWGLGQMKSAIFWYLFVGLALLYRTVLTEGDYNPLKAWVTNTFTFIIVIEFLTSSYTFPLLVELIFVPFVTLIAMMVVVAERNPEQKQVVSVLNWIMAVIGFNVIAYAVNKFIKSSGTLDYAHMMEGFALPIILSLFTIPFFYGLYLFVSYENAFMRFQWTFPDENLRAQAKRQAIKSFGVKTNALGRWARLTQSDRPTNMDEIIQSIEEADQVERWEKNPPPVNPDKGWSPFIAKEFLDKFGVKISDYREYDGRWYAESNIIKTKEGYSQNHMIYLVEGDQLVAETLRLKLTLNDLSQRDKDIGLLVNHAQALVKVAAPELTVDTFIQENIDVEDLEKCFKQFRIKIEKEVIEVGTLVIEEYEFRLEI